MGLLKLTKHMICNIYFCPLLPTLETPTRNYGGRCVGGDCLGLLRLTKHMLSNIYFCHPFSILSTLALVCHSDPLIAMMLRRLKSKSLSAPGTYIYVLIHTLIHDWSKIMVCKDFEYIADGHSCLHMWCKR